MDGGQVTKEYAVLHVKKEGALICEFSMFYVPGPETCIILFNPRSMPCEKGYCYHYFSRMQRRLTEKLNKLSKATQIPSDIANLEQF